MGQMNSSRLSRGLFLLAGVVGFAGVAQYGLEDDGGAVAVAVAIAFSFGAISPRPALMFAFAQVVFAAMFFAVESWANQMFFAGLATSLLTLIAGLVSPRGSRNQISKFVDR